MVSWDIELPFQDDTLYLHNLDERNPKHALLSA